MRTIFNTLYCFITDANQFIGGCGFYLSIALESKFSQTESTICTETKESELN